MTGTASKNPGEVASKHTALQHQQIRHLTLELLQHIPIQPSWERSPSCAIYSPPQRNSRQHSRTRDLQLAAEPRPPKSYHLWPKRSNPRGAPAPRPPILNLLDPATNRPWRRIMRNHTERDLAAGLTSVSGSGRHSMSCSICASRPPHPPPPRKPAESSIRFSRSRDRAPDLPHSGWRSSPTRARAGEGARGQGAGGRRGEGTGRRGAE